MGKEFNLQANLPTDVLQRKLKIVATIAGRMPCTCCQISAAAQAPVALSLTRALFFTTVPSLEIPIDGCRVWPLTEKIRQKKSGRSIGPEN